jgi:hypothetical protein
MSCKLTSRPPIQLRNAVVKNEDIVTAINSVNDSLQEASLPLEGISLKLYDIIDLRMLSGLIGEMFVSELCSVLPFLKKNPNIDGYPDLLDVSSSEARDAIPTLSSDSFIKFPFGGLEVKNTFGVKKSKTDIPHRQSRLQRIQPVLVWKAHHRETNNLIALHCDYVNSVPQIIAAFFADNLDPSDWTEKQQPKEGSTMTSFCQTQKTAFQKLKAGLRCYRPNIGLENYLELEM